MTRDVSRTTDSPLSESLIANTIRGILAVQRQLQEHQFRSDGDQDEFAKNLLVLQQQLEHILIAQRQLQLDQLRQQDQNSRLLDQLDKVIYHQMRQQELIDKIVDFNINYMDRLDRLS